MNNKNFNFFFIIDEEEKISLINFVFKNLIERVYFNWLYIIENFKKLWWVLKVYIIKDEFFFGLIILLLWWGEGEGDFVCYNYIKM